MEQALNVQRIFNNIDYNTPAGWARIEEYAQSVLGPKGYRVTCNSETNTPEIIAKEAVALKLTWRATGKASLLIISGDVTNNIRIRLFPEVELIPIEEDETNDGACLPTQY